MADDSDSAKIKKDNKSEQEGDNDEMKSTEEPREKNQINQGLEDQSTEENVELIYQKKEIKSLKLSFWNVDMYFHQRYKNINVALRQAIEVLAFAFVLLAPIFIYSFIYGEEFPLDDIKGPPKGTIGDTLFRRNFFFVCIYALYSLLYVAGEYVIIFASKLLLYFGVSNSLISWGILQSIYRNREFWIKAILFFYAFNLSNYMYNPFSRTPFAFEFNENIIKTFVLWFAILNIMIFTTKFVIDILTCKIKLSSYREQVRELNYKTFIFIKLKKISDTIAQKDDSTEVEGSEAYVHAESPEYIAENFKPSYDPGFYLTNKQFMTSSEDAELVANNIMVLLGKKFLEYDDIEKYFPENSENVFEFLSGGVNHSAKIKWKKLTKVSVDLFKRRKDVASSIRDRDEIFVDLEMIFVFLTYYFGLIVLMFMFDIDYKFLTVSIGGYLVSFTWVFADSIKNLYNCFLFLLIIRPYNIGDMVRIEDNNYTVYKIELFESVFLSDGNILTYIPNTRLINLNIKNFSRSPPRSEVVEIAVADNTTYKQAHNVVNLLNKNIGDSSDLFDHAELFKIEKGKLTFKIFYKKIDINFEEIKSKRDRAIKLCVSSLNGVTYFNSFVFVEMKFGKHLINDDQIVYRSERSCIFVNIRPFLPYHILVTPVRQASRLSELTSEEFDDLFRTVRFALQHMNTLGDAFTITVQDGEAAGQTVKHVHVHVIPRKTNDLTSNNEIYNETNLDVRKPNRTIEAMAYEAKFLKTMSEKIPFTNVRDIQKEIEESKLKSKGVKLELLKHLLLNFTLFENLSEEEKEISSIKDKLIEISILYRKVEEMECSIEKSMRSKQLGADIIKNKGKASKKGISMNPREKYAKKADKMIERTKPKKDYGINGKRSKKIQ